MFSFGGPATIRHRAVVSEAYWQRGVSILAARSL